MKDKLCLALRPPRKFWTVTVLHATFVCVIVLAGILTSYAGKIKEINSQTTRYGVNSPLIVDVFDLGEPDLLAPGAWKKDRRSSGSLNTVRFFNLDGTRPKYWEWVGPKAGLLVYGQTVPTEVDGTNLFGSVTFGKSWSHGYEPLATLDTNKDGKLNGAELGELWIWLDKNSDAKVQEGEIQPASDYMTEIPLHYESDAVGNTWQNPSVTLKDGRAVRSWDWWSHQPQNMANIYGTIHQAAGVMGLGQPLSSLSIYSWHTTEQGVLAHGLLRFVMVGSGVYVISAATAPVGRPDVAVMVYAKVKKNADSYSWRFRFYFRDVIVDNLVQVDGNRLIGTGNFSYRKNRSSTYGWQGELLGIESSSALQKSMFPVYQLLTSFTDEDFAQAIATFPPQGVFMVTPSSHDPGIQPATAALEALFQR